VIINIEKTLSAFAEDEEIFLSVLEQFTVDFETQKEEFLLSFENKQLDKLHISTHTIKGLAATFYSEELKALAQELEDAAKKENIELIEQRKDEFLLKFEELYAEAKRILNERK
jgi:HPt (histidine-containing phosphotransfer) domain-containing protein